MSLTKSAARIVLAATFAAGLLLPVGSADANGGRSWAGYSGGPWERGCSGGGQYHHHRYCGHGGYNNTVDTYSNPMWPFVDFWGTGAVTAQSCAGFQPVYDRARHIIGYRWENVC